MILLSIFRRKILFSRCFLFPNVNYSKIVITYVSCDIFAKGNQFKINF